MGFDWILGSERNATEDDEDEDEVSEVGVMNEVVAGDSQAEGKGGDVKSGFRKQNVERAASQIYQFFFPRMKKELPSGIGTIFSLGPENSGFSGATPSVEMKELVSMESAWFVFPSPLTFQSLDGSQLFVLRPIILFILHPKTRQLL